MQPKILLVDDREDNLLSMESLFEKDNYRFIKANSGRQALKILLKEFDFALILMDVNMPNLNGFETAALIYERQKLKHIPIIFITANNYGEENVFKGYKMGAVDYIYKPVNPDLLRAKVAVFVDLYRKNHTLLAQEQKLIFINKNLENEIKERKIYEEKIKTLNKELLANIGRLESANKDLDRFAFMASHDLQEPLRKIRIFSDRLNLKFHGLLDEEGRNYLGRIQKVSERMQALINDLLIFSKISVEKDLFLQSDLNKLVGDVLVDMEHTIMEKNAKISVDKLPCLCVNPVLMQPLFYNLISNALKYSKKGADPLIRIRAEVNAEKNQENKYCRILVEDNGIGFDQKYADQVFDMFRRLHPKSEFEGTGIGLALCKKIVEKHNGFISVRSKVDEGSVFIVSLPLQQASLVH
jgi:signal transduction histidine kinase